MAFSVFQPCPWRGPSQASTYLLRICVPMSRNWRRSSLCSVVSALQSSYLTAQKHISPMYIIVNRCVSEKMPDPKDKPVVSKTSWRQKNRLLKKFLCQFSVIQVIVVLEEEKQKVMDSFNSVEDFSPLIPEASSVWLLYVEPQVFKP